MPVNVAVARNEEPVRVSDAHQIPTNNKTLTAKIHVATENRIRQLQWIWCDYRCSSPKNKEKGMVIFNYEEYKNRDLRAVGKHLSRGAETRRELLQHIHDMWSQG